MKGKMTQEDWAKLPLFVKRSMEIIPIRDEISSSIESTGKIRELHPKIGRTGMS